MIPFGLEKAFNTSFLTCAQIPAHTHTTHGRRSSEKQFDFVISALCTYLALSPTPYFCVPMPCNYPRLHNTHTCCPICCLPPLTCPYQKKKSKNGEKRYFVCVTGYFFLRGCEREPRILIQLDPPGKIVGDGGFFARMPRGPRP